MLKAVIFDMDGVIIDSEPLHARANILALKKYGVDLTYDYVTQFIGNTILHMCETIRKDYGLEISAKSLSAESAHQIELLHAKEGYTPIPFVKELIQDLNRHGLKLAIASSSTMELIEKIVDQFELRPYFTKLISGLNVTHSKPAPDIFLKACDELGVTPDEAIIIEDSSNGVLAAVRAGIPVIGYVNTHSGNQDLSKGSILVEGFEEIDTQFIKRTYQHAHNLPADIVHTERLTIRELSMEDVPTLYELYQDESFINSNLRYAATLDEALEKHKAYIQHMYHFHGLGLWGVFLKGTSQLIGHCGIEPKEVWQNGQILDLYELGYGIHTAHQHKGFAKEAIASILHYAKNELYLDTISAVIADDNPASIQLAKLFDFTAEGTVTRCDVQKNKIDKSQTSYTLYQRTFT